MSPKPRNLTYAKTVTHILDTWDPTERPVNKQNHQQLVPGQVGLSGVNFLPQDLSPSEPLAQHSTSHVSLLKMILLFDTNIQWITTPLHTAPLHLCHHPPPFNPLPGSWLLVPFCDPFSLTRAFCVTKRLEKPISSQLFRCSRLLEICEDYQMCFAGEPLTEWTSVTATRGVDPGRFKAWMGTGRQQKYWETFYCHRDCHHKGVLGLQFKNHFNSKNSVSIPSLNW